MPQYIKTHSNYVLKSKHQTLGDGSTVWERDITTIGGLNQFAPGQTPIYRSNNFIITVRNDGGISNQYTTKKWKENDSSGETWTLSALSGMVSDFDEQNDVKIVLKKDYYDFRDFVYYGSLTEMFRASINDIIARFPGELFGTCEKIYYTTYVRDEDTNDRLEKRERLGGDEDLYEVTNPFGIDLHTLIAPRDADPLKFFANDGFKNYLLYKGNSSTAITSWTVTYVCNGEEIPEECECQITNDIEGDIPDTGLVFTFTQKTTCKQPQTSSCCYDVGDKIADIKICVEGGTCYCLSAWMGDNKQIHYLSKKYSTGGDCKGLACDDFHIRPKNTFIDKFRNELDNFQRLILNDNTTPKYKATFSVIYGDDYGYHRQFEDFVFPSSDGGYNIDPTAFGFNAYTSRLADIGEFYDEFFTDNLYRSLTHEAIKNFDWTYTREFEQGDEEEYVIGGQKMQKAIRVFAREFDETISYINNIRTLNRVTYDERDNLPDYFLTDTVENDGWNVQLVIPFDLTEYYVDENGKKTGKNDVYIEDEGDCNGQIWNQRNGKKPFIREFTQSSTTEIRPYSRKDNGYFIGCKTATETGENNCYYKSTTPYKLIKSVQGDTWYDEKDLAGNGLLKYRIKSYSSDELYTYYDVNNEFLKRLKLNSRYILRHKDTREGMEMILGMFGLRSKEFYERDITFNPCRNGIRYGTKDYDYEIDEYWAKTSRIEDKWDCVHNMYRIDWINSTKTIQYDYRSVSNYTNGASMVDYLPYQGLPVRYEDRDGKRYLYPNFEKYEQYDGNPYFQMKGGWQAKQVVGINRTHTYNFQFDAEDKVVFNTGNTCADMLYKETVRNIRRFDTLQEMLSVPSNEVHNGQIVYVSNIKPNTAVVEGYVYDIKTDVRGRYIELVKINGTVRVGEDIYFNEYVRVYGNSSSTTQKSYFLNDLPNGYIIKAYIVGTDQFSCSDDYTNITTIQILSNDSVLMTNYFELTDFYSSNRIDNGSNGGWRRLSVNDNRYKIINTIVNDNKGNNPHNGNMVYDNGTEYFKYYEQLFKHALEEDLFDERCYDDYFGEVEEIGGYGFKFDNAIDIIKEERDAACSYYIKGKNYEIKECNNQITTKVIALNYKTNHDGLKKIIYTDDSTWKNRIQTILNTKYSGKDIKDLTKEELEGLETSLREFCCNPVDGFYDCIDDMYEKLDFYYIKDSGTTTNEILNTKFMKITFYLHNEAFSQQGQCEMKYLDDIVMNYLTQMIPSTTILQIRYEKKVSING